MLAISLFAGALALAQTWPPVQVVRYAGGFQQATHIANAGDGSNRLFVVQQAGRIDIVKNGLANPTPFLDIRDRVNCCGERGLLSIAFPPGYAAKKYFYVYYTDLSGDITVARYRVTANPDIADASSGTVVLTIPHSVYANHNGGQLVFGPDGFLYIGTGDGGGGGDPFGNGQNTNVLLAKILRIDTESGASPYAVPPGNPFASTPGSRAEIWAYGLRNPWRFSFDRATRDLYIADVGQNTYEEVDFQPASSRGGENYGWNRTEGLHCYQAGCSQAGLTLPVAEYDHSTGDCSVTGGFVYRGSRYPTMQGVYFYADYCTGRIRGLRHTASGWQSQILLTTGFSISTFGQDEGGEIYFASQSDGNLYLLTGPPSPVASTSVVSAATFQPGISPGSLSTVFGTGITTVAGILSAPGTPLPLSLNGTSLTVNGLAAPLYAVANVNGREQINFQVPYEIAGSARATVVVSANGFPSAPVDVDVLALQPGLFSADGAHAATYQIGGVLVLLATGLGPTDNPIATGIAPPITPLSRTINRVAVSLDGVDCAVDYAGLAPLYPGVYQINVRIPPAMPPGDRDVQLSVNGVLAPLLKAAVQPFSP